MTSRSCAPDVALCAAGESAWHAVAYAGLGLAWREDEHLGRAETFGHRYLLGAVTLDGAATVPEGVTVPGPVRDSFGTLEPGPGWRSEPADPWMLRAPAPVDDVAVPGVRVERTDDALAFERIAFLAAGGAPPDRPGELHASGSERVPGVRLLVAVRDDGELVGSTLAVVSGRGVHVTGVAVLATEQRRGIGGALTAAAIRCAPERPATLASSELGRGVYVALGFRTVPAHPRQWYPDAPGPSADSQGG